MARPLQKIVICSLALLTACAGGAMMSRSDYENVQLGAPISSVVKEYGDPVLIKANKDGSQSYLYIERIFMGEEVVLENKYSIIVKNGKVVNKRMNWEEPPAYSEIYEEQPNSAQGID